MKYAIYFITNNGVIDSTNVNSANERDLAIKYMLDSNEFKMISWCKIYKSGEYGKRQFILGGI